MIAIGRPLLAERFVLSGFPFVHCMFTSVYGFFCDYVIMFSSVSNKALIDWLIEVHKPWRRVVNGVVASYFS